MTLARRAHRVTFDGNDRKLLVSPQQLALFNRSAYVEICLWSRNIADDGAGDLGGGTAVLQHTYRADADASTDDHWQDFRDADGDTVTFALGRTYQVDTLSGHLAIELTGATDPDLVFYVAY